jgi:CxxC motif-containing protein (DUF1111 family)
LLNFHVTSARRALLHLFVFATCRVNFIAPHRATRRGAKANATFLATSFIFKPIAANFIFHRGGQEMRALLVVSLCIFLFYGCPKKPPEQAELGDPLLGLSEEEVARFEAGKIVFERVFVPEDGLGPLFNANACGECHEDPVPGGVGDEVEVHATKFVSPDFCDPLFQEGGPVVQQQATPLLQATGIEKEEIPPSATSQALRSTPPVFGFGLIDGIPEETILANEDPADMDGDGISGRANRFIDGRMGRFGRKAFVPTLFEFNAGAFPIEQGVTTPLSPTEETINGQPVPPATDPAPDPEVQVSDIEAATDFTRFLAPPPRVFVTDKSDKKVVDRGEKIFKEIGCAKCHIPSMQTGASDVPALNKQAVFLYSDLLLHDMGPELADICLGLATPAEFRSEMLMGLRFREQFLHDGSAKTVREAIERHGGEGEASRAAFENLSEKDKEALLKFLETI